MFWWVLSYHVSPEAGRHPDASLQVVAALDSSQTIAVSQQLVAFAVLAGGEGVWANQRLRKDNPGRANLPATAACGAVMLLVSPLS